MAKPIGGIVVSYDGARGVILLQHPSFTSVEQLAKRYAASKDDRGFWFASFKWAAIAEPDKQLLLRSGKTIRKALVGRRVICTAVRDPKWCAAWLSVDFEHQRFRLPDRVVHPERHRPQGPGKQQKKRLTVGEKRRLGAIRIGRSNARRPWGGMAQ
jgi:hypothetical protein